jgi:phospholipid-binding lipoprotein MlaA
LEYGATYFVVNGLDQRLEFDAELAEIRATDDPYGVRRDTYLARRAREIAALKGEVIPDPEADEPTRADDVPPQSSLSLPERLQITASNTSGGH